MNPNEPNEPGEADQPITIGADGQPVEVPDGWGPVDGPVVTEHVVTEHGGRHEPTVQLIVRVLDRVRAVLIRQALARGYCTPANQNKVLDPQLIEAMTDEVMGVVRDSRMFGAAARPTPRRDDAEVIRHALGILRADASLRAAWHANLAMAMKDEGVDHDTAQRAATRFLDLLTKGAPTPPPRSMDALNSAIDCVNASGMKVAAEGMEILPRQLIPDDQLDSWFVMDNDASRVTGPYADRDAAMAVWRTGTNVACVQGRIIQWQWSQRLEQIMRMSQVDAPAGHRI